ncbi:MAG: hypothetical protein MMC23_004720 [Stictis urceolatum]|nr:hypothetical protein [Stictis urceolata]
MPCGFRKLNKDGSKCGLEHEIFFKDRHPKYDCRHRPVGYDRKLHGLHPQSHHIEDIRAAFTNCWDAPMGQWSDRRVANYNDLVDYWENDDTLKREDEVGPWPNDKVANEYFDLLDRLFFDGRLRSWVTLKVVGSDDLYRHGRRIAGSTMYVNDNKPHVLIKLSDRSELTHDLGRRRAEVLSTLLHEMVHAIGRVYACNAIPCGQLEHVINGIGLTGHAPVFKSMATRVASLFVSFSCYDHRRFDALNCTHSVEDERLISVEEWKRWRPGQPYPRELEEPSRYGLELEWPSDSDEGSDPGEPDDPYLPADDL